jgi:hypothetical protein
VFFQAAEFFAEQPILEATGGTTSFRLLLYGSSAVSEIDLLSHGDFEQLVDCFDWLGMTAYQALPDLQLELP